MLYHKDDRIEIHQGDCREVLAGLPERRFHAVVTDPPYELGFNGTKWDSTGVAFDPKTWQAVLRVVRPGAYMACFGGSRTFHRIACAIEDAGWWIDDHLLWFYGQGYPHGLDVSKAIDKEMGKGAERKETGEPQTPEAARWRGWNTKLKPAYEPIILAQAPFDGTIARNALTHGTGGINVGALRVEAPDQDELDAARSSMAGRVSKASLFTSHKVVRPTMDPGRYPSNILLSEDVAPFVDALAGGASVSRMFWCAKASEAEREAMLGELQAEHVGGAKSGVDGAGLLSGRRRNNHATVKPIAVMRWLLRLLVPHGGEVLDPFVGSGTTLRAANEEVVLACGVELSERHCLIAKTRCRDGALPLGFGTPIDQTA